MKNKELDEILVNKAREGFARVPYVKLLGMEMLDISFGEARLKLKMRDELRQPYGVCTAARPHP